MDAFSKEYFKTLSSIKRNPIFLLNGVFDIVHIGHINMINKIKKERNEWNKMTKIVAAINSDESVKKLNKSHPLVHNQDYRARMLLELGVDYVIIFDNKNPLDIIMSMLPDKVYKGEDYYGKDFPEKPFIHSYGGEIKYVELVKNNDYKYSSTDIYNTIANNVKQEIRESLQ
jgi:rfaE bifunctional protein nucleotidyltransferase chain/domain